MTEFITKDSGEREQFESGMQRDTESGKPRFDLMIPEGVPFEEQLLTRFAMLLSRGAEKYDARNWEQGDSEKEIDRAKSSGFRHFMQWICGEIDEDHAVAVIFNIMVVETIKRKLQREREADRIWVIPGSQVRIAPLDHEWQEIVSDEPEPVLTECPHDHLHTLDCPHVTIEQLREQAKSKGVEPVRPDSSFFRPVVHVQGGAQIVPREDLRMRDDRRQG